MDPPDVTVARRATLISPTVRPVSARRLAQGMNLQFQSHLLTADTFLDPARKYATSRMGSARATTTTAAASATSATWDIFSTPTAKVS